ncbi:O-antigen polymerase [Shewanella woodyi]|uniref:Oligosaccharide repeat unit polymerase n=1 Tax=Shewanella woodyi (strain ATCC 51908 / MS32) TaxID=392500 RepID=B1KME6_SHEWM|nr:hypothetical protein [Shewanella woodyi]ACA85944.1 hypothetical protein Swoo_1658 [Shewanella woodyi ATCC 51908]
MKLISYRYLPLNIFLLYTFFVMFALFFGPAQFRNMNFLYLASFLIINTFIFVFFFIAGAKGIVKWEHKKSKNNFIEGSFFKFFLYSGLLLSIVAWGDFFVSGKSISISNMGTNYVDGYDGYVRGSSSIGFSYILNIFSVSLQTLSLLFIFSNYIFLNKKQKLIACFVIFTYLIINVLVSGKQKYLGDIVIFFVYSYLIFSAVQNKRFSVSKILNYCFVFSVVVFSFSYILTSRYAAIDIDGSNIATALNSHVYWDSESIIIKIFGNTFGFGIGMFLGYFTNGLYGLNLALQLPFEWTYFLGNSYSLAKIVETAISSPGLILQHSYPFRAEELGWGLDKWHSAFSWLASDLTFPGTLCFMAFFSFSYARVWIASINNSNPFARPLFIYLSVGIVFVYSNNQLVHSLSGVFVLFALVIMYFIYKFQSRQVYV